MDCCVECPGFCCKLFFFPLNKKQLRARLRETRAKLAVLWSKPLRTCRALRKAQTLIDDVHDCLFLLKYGIRVRGRVLNTRTGLREHPSRYAYTCAKFDQTIGECTVWYDRPSFCRLYLCQAAREARTPVLADFQFTHQFTEEEVSQIWEHRAEVCALTAAKLNFNKEDQDCEVAQGCVDGGRTKGGPG